MSWPVEINVKWHLQCDRGRLSDCRWDAYGEQGRNQVLPNPSSATEDKGRITESNRTNLAEPQETARVLLAC